MSFTTLFQALSPFFRPWLGAMALVGVILLGEIAFNDVNHLVNRGLLRKEDWIGLLR